MFLLFDIRIESDIFLPVCIKYCQYVAVQAQYEMHLAEMEAVKAGMPVVFVNHDGNESGPAIRDIHMENFSISVGGKDLIQDASLTLSFGRHYG